MQPVVGGLILAEIPYPVLTIQTNQIAILPMVSLFWCQEMPMMISAGMHRYRAASWMILVLQ